MAEPKFEILADGFSFLEGPRWKDGYLWCSDMGAGEIFKVTEAGAVTKVAEVANKCSGLSFQPDGRLVVVSMGDRKLYVVDDAGGLSEYADLSALVTGDINDCVTDSAGNIYVGNFGHDMASGEALKPANIVRVAPGGAVSIAAEDMVFPNGSVLTPDEGTLICAETFANRLTAFTRADDGALTDRRVWAPLEGHLPDGICLDAEGAVWVSSIEAGVFLRVAEGGEILQTLKPHSKRAVACNLGGADGRTLFAMTFDGEFDEIFAGVKKARIEVCRVETPGAGSP